MLSNAYFLAKIGADTAENEQRFAEILPTDRRSLTYHDGLQLLAGERAVGREPDGGLAALPSQLLGCNAIRFTRACTK